jgi:hypothetical protein
MYQNNNCYYEFKNITLEIGCESKWFEILKIEDNVELELDINVFTIFFCISLKFKAIHMRYFTK